jgi:type VII secretion-associated serine protease mycosin
MLRTGRAVALVSLVAAVSIIVPAPPAYADQIRNLQWHLRFLNVAAAHQITRGEGITVAVIDSGVDPHPDLRNNLLPGADFLEGGDGRTDPKGHGTAMAGLIAAHGRAKNQGVLGIAPHAKLLPVRYTDLVTITDVENGVDRSVSWAMEHGADVISISLGGGPDADDRKAIEEAIAGNVVVVAAVGNRPDDRLVQFPAAYPGVVAVAAIGRDGAIAPVSVRGDQVVIAAPGVDIVSTSRNDEYRKATGTSDATAIVAGAVALVRSRFPNLSAAEVVHRLTATATDKGPKGRDDQYGYGVLNLVAALTADVPRLEADGTSAPRSPTPSTTTAVAAPGGNGGRDVAALVGAVAVAALLGGGLVMLAVRRRRPGR